MVAGKLQWVASNILRYVLFLLCLVLVFSCQTKDNSTSVKTWNVTEFQNGDIVYRCGNGFFSDYFRKSSSREQVYSHCGIITVDDNGVYVIHSEASELTGIGGVRKESLSVFLKDITTWAVYRLDTTHIVRDSIVSIASQYLEKKTSFDLDFDNNSDEQVYCTELIALSINKATHLDMIKARGNIRNKPYYAIDDTYLIDQMKAITINKP